MKRMSRILLAGAGAIGLSLSGYGIAEAAGNGGASGVSEDGPNEAADSDTPLVGTDLEKAVAAALDHLGEGEVTETEVGDDGAAFGVEVRLADGSQLEVNLDAEFNVISSGPD